MKLIAISISFRYKVELEFTPLEFETKGVGKDPFLKNKLEFTPLEFETLVAELKPCFLELEFTPLEFETILYAKYKA